jgi:hypothetical protein
MWASSQNFSSKFPGIKKIFNEFGGDFSSFITTYKTIEFSLKSWNFELKF